MDHRCTRAAVALASALLAAPTQAELDIDSVRIRAVSMTTGVPEYLLVSLRRREGGPRGNEMGYETKNRLHVSSIACLPAGSEQYAKAALAIQRTLWLYAFQNEWHFKQWSMMFAKYYHAGDDKTNVEYARVLRQIILQEVKRQGERGYYNPYAEAP